MARLFKILLSISLIFNLFQTTALAATPATPVCQVTDTNGGTLSLDNSMKNFSYIVRFPNIGNLNYDVYHQGQHIDDGIPCGQGGVNRQVVTKKDSNGYYIAVTDCKDLSQINPPTLNVQVVPHGESLQDAAKNNDLACQVTENINTHGGEKGGCQIALDTPVDQLKPGQPISFKITEDDSKSKLDPGKTYGFRIHLKNADGSELKTAGGDFPFTQVDLFPSDLFSKDIVVSGLPQIPSTERYWPEVFQGDKFNEGPRCIGQSFGINVDTSKVITGANCFICINGSTWDGNACTGGASGAPLSSDLYCDNPNQCDHTYGCLNKVKSPFCPPPYKTDTNGFCTTNTFNPCPSPNKIDASGNCSAVDTGLGISIASEKTAFAATLMGIILSIAGIVALFIIITTGYRLMTSQGDPEKIKGARESITAAIVGLVFIIFSLAVLSFIGVDVLHIPGFTNGSSSNSTQDSSHSSSIENGAGARNNSAPNTNTGQGVKNGPRP